MITKYITSLKSGKTTATKTCAEYVARAKQDTKNVVLEIFPSWKQLAATIDKKVAAKKPLGKLAGVPILIKDNFLYKGHTSSSGSTMLKNFVAPYTSTVVQKLLDADAVIIGRVNMDGLAMGAYGENSGFGATKHPLSDAHATGGSSSGSAAAVALDYCMVSLGSDTGGSVRNPASFCGVVGLKPSYGVVSRYGISAYGSGFEQAGVLAKTIDDTRLVFDVIAGKCPHDATTSNRQITVAPTRPLAELKIGRITQLWNSIPGTCVEPNYNRALEFLKSNGAKIVDISIPEIDHVLPAYYVLVPAQAASNLSRFDGVRYTSSVADPETLEQLYKDTRNQFFGSVVKRQTLIGNFTLREGQANDLFHRANTFAQHLRDKFNAAFEKVDFIISPMTTHPAKPLGKSSDPMEEYLIDLYTIPANIAGIPAISVPCGTVDGFPIGIQLLAPQYAEHQLLDFAKKMEGSK